MIAFISKRYMQLAAAAGAFALAAGCSSSKKPAKPPATPVRVAPVARINAPINLAASGVVEPMQTVAVTTQVTGALEDILFREGETVTAGQLLFRIDPRPLEAALDQARATLARDAAQAAAGRADDIRYQTLAGKGYVSRSQADQIHATALAQAATIEADRAALRAAVVNLGFATIRAPITGRTGSLQFRKGNIVSPASGALVVINQLRPVLVRFPVSDQDFPAVKQALASHPLPVTATPSDTTQASEHGQLAFLDNAIDSLTGTVTGKASFPNAEGRLWPGELIFLTIQVAVKPNVVAVPNEALQSGQQGNYVYVVDAKNTAQTRNVVPSNIVVGGLTVIASGLTDGERVVIDGQSRLNPGSHVSILSAPAGGDTAGRTLSATGVGPRGGAPGGSPTAAGGTAGGEVTTGVYSGATSPNAGMGGGRLSPAAGAAGAAATGQGGTVVGGLTTIRSNTPTVAPAPSIGTATGATSPSTTPAPNAATAPAPTTPAMTRPAVTTPAVTTPRTTTPVTRSPTPGTTTPQRP